MKYLFTFFIVFIATIELLQAQYGPLNSVQVRFSSSLGPDSVDVNGTMVEKERFYGTLIIDLENTDNIDEVIIGAGTESLGTNILSKTFTFANLQHRDSGLQYVRKGNEIRIHLGEFSTLPEGYAWVKLHMTNDSYTDAREQAIN